MKRIAMLVAALSCAGCASFTTTQTDISYEKGEVVRAITTRVTARTLIEADSELSKFKASQTDKTQGASVGALSQSAQSTNTLDGLTGLIDALGRLR